MNSHSIRRRLLVGLTAATVTLWLLVIGATYLGANREIDALFDTQLEQSARVATRTLFGLPALENVPRESEPSGQYAPQQPLTDGHSGFADSLIDDVRWRTYSFYDETSGLTVRAGEPYLPRDYLTRHVVIQTMYPVLIGLPVVTLMIWIIVGRGFGPLNRLAAEVHRRDPDNLDPIKAPYAPDEVRTLVDELNVLLDRLKDRIDKERHFVADAAHELRTPLAGLKAQAQVAMGARNASERDRSLHHILAGVDRASHLVNQLLTLSRLDESDHFTKEPVNLNETVRAVIMDSLENADHRNIELSFDPSTTRARVRGNPDALYILVRNIVDNAIKYSATGTQVTIGLQAVNGSVLFSVSDQGPGIPPADRDKVFDRFHRRAMSDAYGSGLGLSIVRRVVELHDGTVNLREARSGGLLVEVELPATGDHARAAASLDTGRGRQERGEPFQGAKTGANLAPRLPDTA